MKMQIFFKWRAINRCAIYHDPTEVLHIVVEMNTCKKQPDIRSERIKMLDKDPNRRTIVYKLFEIKTSVVLSKE